VAEQTSEQAAQAREKATQERAEAAKKKIADEKAAREQRMADQPDAGKPTPTQEENDLAASGVHIPEHEPDGSPVQESNTLQSNPLQQRQSRPAQQQGGYATRAATPKPPAS